MDEWHCKHDMSDENWNHHRTWGCFSLQKKLEAILCIIDLAEAAIILNSNEWVCREGLGRVNKCSDNNEYVSNYENMLLYISWISMKRNMSQQWKSEVVTFFPSFWRHVHYICSNTKQKKSHNEQWRMIFFEAFHIFNNIVVLQDMKRIPPFFFERTSTFNANSLKTNTSRGGRCRIDEILKNFKT